MYLGGGGGSWEVKGGTRDKVTPSATYKQPAFVVNASLLFISRCHSPPEHATSVQVQNNLIPRDGLMGAPPNQARNSFRIFPVGGTAQIACCPSQDMRLAYCR